MPAALQRLIAPTTVESFIAEIWEQTHLHVSRADNPSLGGYFEELISYDDVDYLLTMVCGAGPQRWDAVRLSQNGTPLPPTEFQSDRQGPVAEFDIPRILSLYRDGATLIMNGVDRLLGPIGTLCGDLARSFGVRVLANLYITPPGGQGFAPHFDDHDVFLLQVSGEKDWDLYGSPIPLAMAEHRTRDRNDRVAAETELSLRAGEVLYIPRGLVHGGSASTEASFHLTVGVHSYSWAELLTDALAELERDDLELRRSVSAQLGEAAREGGSLADTARLLVGRLCDGERLARAAERHLARACGESRAPLRGRFARLAEPREVTAQTKLRAADAEIHLHVDGQEVVVTSSDRVLTLPRFVEPHLGVLLSGEPVCAAELPPSLDEAGRLTLVRRLVGEGVLEADE